MHHLPHRDGLRGRGRWRSKGLRFLRFGTDDEAALPPLRAAVVRGVNDVVGDAVAQLREAAEDAVQVGGKLWSRQAGYVFKEEGARPALVDAADGVLKEVAFVVLPSPLASARERLARHAACHQVDLASVLGKVDRGEVGVEQVLVEAILTQGLDAPIVAFHHQQVTIARSL